MKYKPGDKVRIIKSNRYNELAASELKNLFIPYEGMIDKIEYNGIMEENCYVLKGLRWDFQEKYIECLVKDYVKPERIESRFEILDIR